MKLIKDMTDDPRPAPASVRKITPSSPSNKPGHRPTKAPMFVFAGIAIIVICGVAAITVVRIILSEERRQHRIIDERNRRNP